MYKVCAFTGTRMGMTALQHREVDKMMPGIELMHNGAARGADTDAARIAEMHMVPVIAHPAAGVKEKDKARIHAIEWREPKPPIERNHEMVDESEALLATPGEYDEVLRSGTWATIRYAKDCAKPVIIIFPDGRVDRSYKGLVP